MEYKCSYGNRGAGCGATNAFVNQCGCDPDNMPTKVPDDTPEQIAAGLRADVDSCSLEELEATADFYDRLVRGETPCSTIEEKNESGGAA